VPAKDHSAAVYRSRQRDYDGAVSVPRFYAPEARAGHASVALSPEEAHHLTHVLRLGSGADVAVFDGAGREWAGRVASAGKRRVTIELGDPVTAAPEPPVRVTLGMAVLKGDQMDAVVRDATVLGVIAIAPFISAHVTVPTRAWKGEAARARWQRVAVAAAKQSRRAVVPELLAVTSFEALVRAGGDATVVMCVEPARATTPLEPVESRPPSAALVLVGPEGGWADPEVAHARDRGARLLALGPRTLRAELAPVVALSSLWTRWGW
jgi:16S rRNA (uracil1498-N3)-methyltransferase